MKIILFDLDGVITSERIYWNCSGLALARYLDKKIPAGEKEKIKLAQRLLPDEITRGFKEAGINSNWDIAYAMSVLSELGKDAKWFLAELRRRGLKGLQYLSLLDEIDPRERHDRDGGPWKEAHKRFQACYYDLKDTDDTAIPLEKVKAALERLKSMGFNLGIVTGRPLDEAQRPLKKWGLWGYFEPSLIVTEDEVAEESKKRGEHLGKPNPWPILHAIFRHEKCDSCDVKEIAKDYIFVGDSVADVLAAKNAGIPVICVTTGLASEESLRKAGADIIVKDLSYVPAAIAGLS